MMIGPRYELPRIEGSCTLCDVDSPGFSDPDTSAMQRLDDDIENARIADNLRRTIELTELGLALRRSVLLQQGYSDDDAMTKVMCDIRRTKELAWRQDAD